METLRQKMVSKFYSLHDFLIHPRETEGSRKRMYERWIEFARKRGASYVIGVWDSFELDAQPHLIDSSVNLKDEVQRLDKLYGSTDSLSLTSEIIDVGSGEILFTKNFI